MEGGGHLMPPPVQGRPKKPSLNRVKTSCTVLSSLNSCVSFHAPVINTHHILIIVMAKVYMIKSKISFYFFVYNYIKMEWG